MVKHLIVVKSWVNFPAQSSFTANLPFVFTFQPCSPLSQILENCVISHCGNNYSLCWIICSENHVHSLTTQFCSCFLAHDKQSNIQVSLLRSRMYQDMELILFSKFRNYLKYLVPGLFKTIMLGFNLWKIT